MCGFDLMGLAPCPQLFIFCLWLLLLGKARSCLIDIDLKLKKRKTIWTSLSAPSEKPNSLEELLPHHQGQRSRMRLTSRDDACFVKYVLSGRCRSTQAGAKDVVWRVDSPSMAGRIAWIARIGPQPHSNPRIVSSGQFGQCPRMRSIFFWI